MTNDAYNLILKADENGSDGQYHASQFVKSLLNYGYRCDLREILYLFEMQTITELMQMSKEDRLYTAVKEINPKLLTT